MSTVLEEIASPYTVAIWTVRRRPSRMVDVCSQNPMEAILNALAQLNMDITSVSGIQVFPRTQENTVCKQ